MVFSIQPFSYLAIFHIGEQRFCIFVNKDFNFLVDFWYPRISLEIGGTFILLAFTNYKKNKIQQKLVL